MQVGCGVYVHRVRERPYLYFWHYETRGRSRVQVNEYVGPAKSSKSITEAMRRCDAYYTKAASELERLRVSSVTAIRTLA
jgi:hypothetical protein